MKITLVVDTDDEQGVVDSFKIVSHFFKKTQGRARYTSYEVKYGKISFIKMLRKFAKAAKEAEEEGIDSSSLRFAKMHADEIFSEVKAL
jgi:hypothetical protein